MPPDPQPPAAALAAADGRRLAPAAARNLEPLTAVLETILPPAGRVLEVASGTGQHVAHWARSFPDLAFHPSDVEPAARASIVAWCDGLQNCAAPLALDVTAAGWWRAAPGPWNAVIAVNLVHIAPWQATLGLLAGAGAELAAAGRLILYGPFAEHGRLEPESNRLFDAQLRAQDPRWGVRDRAEIEAAGHAVGLVLARRIAMPANNSVLVLERRACG